MKEDKFQKPLRRTLRAAMWGALLGGSAMIAWWFLVYLIGTVSGESHPVAGISMTIFFVCETIGDWIGISFKTLYATNLFGLAFFIPFSVPVFAVIGAVVSAVGSCFWNSMKRKSTENA